MNRFILILSLVVVFSGSQSKAQNWAPDGAEWHYEYVNFWFVGYVHITVLGDTMIHDTNCRVLDRVSVIHNLEFGTTNTYYHGHCYMYSDEDRVYLYENNKFYPIYDFSALPGDTIIIPQNGNLSGVGCDPEGMIRVVDTATVEINGQQLRSISVEPLDESHWAIYGEIHETIGPVSFYMLPEPHWCVIDLYEGGRLRCYSDPDFGIFSTGISPECDYLVSVPELEESRINIFPNPCSDILHIQAIGMVPGSELKIYSSTGQCVKVQELYSLKNQIDISELIPGFYYIQMQLGDVDINRKIVVK